jgi:hypothetical protein
MKTYTVTRLDKYCKLTYSNVGDNYKTMKDAKAAILYDTLVAVGGMTSDYSELKVKPLITDLPPAYRTFYMQIKDLCFKFAIHRN